MRSSAISLFDSKLLHDVPCLFLMRSVVMVPDVASGWLCTCYSYSEGSTTGEQLTVNAGNDEGGGCGLRPTQDKLGISAPHSWLLWCLAFP